MQNFEDNTTEQDSGLAAKIQWLIFGRLMVVFFLLAAGWIWKSGTLALSFENIPQGLFYVFIISVSLTIIYFLALKFFPFREWQIRLQIVVDIALVTQLVWQTGDVNSPYITLYTVLICVASFFLGARGTLLLASTCALVFTLLVYGVWLGAITPAIEEDASQQLGKIIQIIGFHDVAFLVVGLLASRLASRHSASSKLQEATKSLADLRLLHERIIESVRSGLVTTDLDGKIYIFNAAAEEITGYRSAELRGNSIFTLLGKIEQPIKVSLEAAERGEQPPRFEIDFTTPENLGVRLGYGISPLFDEQGEIKGLIITFQDLTEMRSMEESARRKDRLAAVGRVAAGLAHEIRNPLGAMRGALQVLQTQIPDDLTNNGLIEIIKTESDRLNKIISNFLTYARPHASSFTEVDVGEAISDSFTLLRHSPEIGEGHSLVTDLPDEKIALMADSTQLKQVFWNLARNAIQAMPDGGELKVKLQRRDNGRVQIIFSDTGRGMTPDQVNRLFEPFSESSTGGTGLGLSIVYQIVRDHGGTINVRSLENKGTTITIELPGEMKPASSRSNFPEDDGVHEPSRLESFLTANEKEK
ncbi:MAG TPA: ATP-binding protein [Pyrinomonadaceae bacterium]|jgi:two-component system sensor histidine kinase PilS (NtrC family)|nr:ATP-binding protein [Pyrinomonadaceae bacterium]